MRYKLVLNEQGRIQKMQISIYLMKESELK